MTLSQPWVLAIFSASSQTFGMVALLHQTMTGLVPLKPWQTYMGYSLGAGSARYFSFFILFNNLFARWRMQLATWYP